MGVNLVDQYHEDYVCGYEKLYMQNTDTKSIDHYPENYVAYGICTHMNEFSKSMDYCIKGYLVVRKYQQTDL